MAQFNGRTVTARSAGSAVIGHVRSIVENKSSAPAAWTITIIPEEPKPTILVAVRASRLLFRGRSPLSGRMNGRVVSPDNPQSDKSGR